MSRARTIMRTAILFVIFLGIGAALYSHFVMDKTKVKVGAEAPDFVLQSLSGEPIQLSQYRGKGVVLNFWGTWCTPCRDEMPALETNYQQFKDQGIAFIAVNIAESNVTVESFKNRYQLTFPIAMDRSREIVQLYQVKEIPSTFFIDKNGIVNKHIVGGPMSEQTIRENIQLIVPE